MATATTSSSSSATQSKKSRALAYMAAGNSLTAAQARSRFGIRNFRATVSSIKSLVENYGNWRIVTSENSRGFNSYSMKRVLLVNPTVDRSSATNRVNNSR